MRSYLYHTGRSILAAILFHFSGNLSGELVPHGAVGGYLTFLVPLVVAIVVVIVYGPATLRRRHHGRSSGEGGW